VAKGDFSGSFFVQWVQGTEDVSVGCQTVLEMVEDALSDFRSSFREDCVDVNA